MIRARDVEAYLIRRIGRPRVHGLTKTQWAVLNLVSKGLYNKQIGEILFVTEKAIKFCLNTIYAETRVRNRVELIRWAAFTRKYGRPPGPGEL